MNYRRAIATATTIAVLSTPHTTLAQSSWTLVATAEKVSFYVNTASIRINAEGYREFTGRLIDNGSDTSRQFEADCYNWLFRKKGEQWQKQDESFYVEKVLMAVCPGNDRVGILGRSAISNPDLSTIGCHIKTSDGRIWDLNKMCNGGSFSLRSWFYSGRVDGKFPDPDSRGGGGSGSGSGGGGNCTSPDDLDARGNRCGGRAADVRQGGRGIR